MPRIKITCPHCQKILWCREHHRGKSLKCPYCKQLVLVPAAVVIEVSPQPPKRKARKILFISGGLLLLAAAVMIALCFVFPVRVHWTDRRPVGVLFLASDYHASATNPRGWFNDRTLDIHGTNGLERFKQALDEYAERSLAILKRTDAQGVIVWDLEGEQFPHKTTYIGDPRLLAKLAPEMDALADEFFARFRNAGLRVGITIRPQELVFENGLPRQSTVLNLRKVLREKIGYARKRWGATLFYIDSNYGLYRPDDYWQLRALAAEFPDCLLIPEHHALPYWAFSAPYVSLNKGQVSPATTSRARQIFSNSFQALDISDAARFSDRIQVARTHGDLLLFHAWVWSPECDLLEQLAKENPPARP